MSLASDRMLQRILRSILQVQTSHPLPIMACALLLAGLSVFFTVTRLEFETSQSALISSENRLMQMLKVADRFSKHDAFIVAVENKDKGRSLEFVRSLGPRLEADRRHFAKVFFRVNPADFRPWALLYLSPEKLEELTANITKHESFIQALARSPGLVTFFEEINKEMASQMVGYLFTGFLGPATEERDEEPMNLDVLLTSLRELKASVEGSSTFSSPFHNFLSKGDWGDEAEEGYFWTESKKYLLVFVSPKTKREGGSGKEEALIALRRAVSSLQREFPGVEAGVTGQKALDEDEKNIAFKDISTATIASLMGLAALLLIFWRTVRRPLLQLTTQTVALSLTFGLTTLVIGHLNLLSVTFAPMVLGLGIDYDIHWFSRYNEERLKRGQSTKGALVATMDKLGPAILLAALSTCLAFLPLTLTGFKGLAELGLICGMGLFVSSATTVCLLPALIVLFDKPGSRHILHDQEDVVKPFLGVTKTRARLIMVLTLIVTGLSLWGAGKVKFDLNMLHLQSKSAESVVWETKLVEGSKNPSIYGVLFARSLNEVQEKTKALTKLSSVSRVQSIESFLPADQTDKIPLLHRMKPVVAAVPPVSGQSIPIDMARLKDVLSRIRFKMEETGGNSWGTHRPLEAQMREARSLIETLRRDLSSVDPTVLISRLRAFEGRLAADLKDKLSLLRENVNGRPMEISDLPQPVRDRFVGSGDLFLIRVFPGSNIWDPQNLAAFVKDLRSVDPDATGDPVTLSILTREFRDASIKAALYALVLILIFLTFMLRSPFLALAAITPLVMGAIWTFGLMYLLGVNLNLANTIFLPLVIGAGVEYGVIIVKRWQQRKDGEAGPALPLSTGMGVLLAGLTTTIGFGSLMISRHQGIHSLGLLTTIGSLAVLAAALLALPAAFTLLRANREERNGDEDGSGASRTDEDESAKNCRSNAPAKMGAHDAWRNTQEEQ